MSDKYRRIRVLYSFPHKIGADQICSTAWHQVNGLANAGVDLQVYPGVLYKPLPPGVKIHPTLACGKLRIPYRFLGRIGACRLHDYIVSRSVAKYANQIDLIHTWPVGALKTLKVAAKYGIPTVLERPNAHTRFAYEVVQKECERLGVPLPAHHEHSYNETILQREEMEYRLADKLLCPSDFVARTFIEHGFPPNKLARHQYGFDPDIFFPGRQNATHSQGLTMMFAGGCAPRKGLHYALEAWLQSKAHKNGSFLIAGEFIPGYANKLSAMLSHPSVKVLGHCNNVADLMRQSDVFILSSIEEGSALVTSEARGCGCVLLVSQATGAVCEHLNNALIHQAGDIMTLTQHISLLEENRELLGRLRASSLSTIHEITWQAAGAKLLSVYREVLAEKDISDMPH